MFDFVSIYNTLATFRGAENHHVSVFFLEPSFGRAFGTHFGDFGSLLGSLLGTILVTFWVPFLYRFLDPLKTSKKGGGALAVLCQTLGGLDTVSPLLGLFPPS